MSYRVSKADGLGLRKSVTFVTASDSRRRAPLAIATGFILVALSVLLIGPDVASVMANDDAGMRDFLTTEGRKSRPASAPSRFESWAAKNSFFAPRAKQAEPTPTYNAYAPTESLKSPFNLKVKKKYVAANIDLTTPSLGANTLGHRAVCVRLCDGFFFPLGPAENTDENAALCTGLCPGAPTRVYHVPSGSEKIDEAKSTRDGSPYTSLPVAFRYTSTADKTCACRPDNVNHTKIVSLMKDFTLRKGDSVMTQRGIRVFRGTTNYPYRQRDFLSLAATEDLPSGKRSALSAIERATGHAVPRKLVVPKATSPRSAQPGPYTPINVVKDPQGRPIRAIGPQAMLRD